MGIRPNAHINIPVSRNRGAGSAGKISLAVLIRKDPDDTAVAFFSPKPKAAYNPNRSGAWRWGRPFAYSL
jgi:hypothetical protein